MTPLPENQATPGEGTGPTGTQSPTLTLSQPASELSPEEMRQKAIVAYYEAPTKEAKRALVAKHPFLAGVFSEANHS